MNELSRHIEILLLKHNCVIIPDLGGFITQYVPARYVAEENIFLPPYRTVVFNPQLTLNDGLLVQSYMKIYDTNYPETVRLIEQQVVNLKNEIQEKGEIKLNGIGTLATNIDGTLIFEPNEAGIASPALYGLEPVTVQKQSKKKHFSNKTNLPEYQKVINVKNYTFSINKELVNYVVAAMISVFFYFIWATPLTDSSSLTPQKASTLFPHTLQHLKEEIPECIPTDSLSSFGARDYYSNTAVIKEEIYTMQPESVANNVLRPNITAAEPQKESESVAERESEIKITNQVEEAEHQELASIDNLPFTIVLASRIPRNNAEAFAEKMHKDGYKDVTVFQKRNIVRVVLGSYASESEAHEALHQYRKESNLFKEAWVLNKN